MYAHKGDRQPQQQQLDIATLWKLQVSSEASKRARVNINRDKERYIIRIQRMRELSLGALRAQLGIQGIRKRAEEFIKVFKLENVLQRN